MRRLVGGTLKSLIMTRNSSNSVMAHANLADPCAIVFLFKKLSDTLGKKRIGMGPSCLPPTPHPETSARDPRNSQ